MATSIFADIPSPEPTPRCLPAYVEAGAADVRLQSNQDAGAEGCSEAAVEHAPQTSLPFLSSPDTTSINKYAQNPQSEPMETPATATAFAHKKAEKQSATARISPSVPFTSGDQQRMKENDSVTAAKLMAAAEQVVLSEEQLEARATYFFERAARLHADFAALVAGGRMDTTLDYFEVAELSRNVCDLKMSSSAMAEALAEMDPTRSGRCVRPSCCSSNTSCIVHRPITACHLGSLSPNLKSGGKKTVGSGTQLLA